MHDGRRTVVAAADAAAATLGLHPGMALAHAQAIVPGLHVAAADPHGDAAARARLAAWCLRLSPLSAPDTDGLWIDATGCTHLHGGERAMLDAVLARLVADGMAARAAIAGTPGAAHALARYGPDAVTVVPPGGDETAIAPLPATALRLGDDSTLLRLGLDTVGDLMALPRGPLARRFGTGLLLRLDQALGRVAEPINPVAPPDIPQARMAFPEPLLTAESFVAVIGLLVPRVCMVLEQAGLGARHLDLRFERVDGTLQAVRIGTARPSRDARHLGRLLEEQVETVDPGLGVEAVHLLATFVEPLAYSQVANLAAETEADVATLVDRLTNRLGPDRVWRAASVESDVPERSVRRVPAVSPPGKAAWPSWPRPTRLLHPPQPVQTLSTLPDEPPTAFTWRRHRHRVRRADGPERIAGEWWRRDAEIGAVRDYWQVEDEGGRRFWLYRRGDGQDAATGDLRWFVHGVF